VKKIAFIINPKSGTQNKTHIVKVIQNYFLSPDFTVDIYRTTHAGDGYCRTKEYVQDGYDIVVAVGGDGTVNEVASGLMGSDTALGILPCGSGNGLALHLKIPLQLAAALKKIKEGNSKLIDAGIINERPFFCTAGVGYDAYIANRFAEAGKRGPIAYVSEIVLQYFDYKPQKYKLIFDDGTVIERKAFLITFANASQWGNNAAIAPRASVEDGLMDIVVMADFPIYVAPQISFCLFTRQLDKTHYVEVYKCQNVIVEREEGDAAHYDGEPVTMSSHLDVKILPKILKVVV